MAKPIELRFSNTMATADALRKLAQIAKDFAAQLEAQDDSDLVDLAGAYTEFYEQVEHELDWID